MLNSHIFEDMRPNGTRKVYLQAIKIREKSASNANIVCIQIDIHTFIYRGIFEDSDAPNDIQQPQYVAMYGRYRVDFPDMNSAIFLT